MHRLLSRFVNRTAEVRPVEAAVRPRTTSSINRPPAVPRRSLNEAAHKQRR
jgi:hypothetical protein